jgi:hypothetical protein
MTDVSNCCVAALAARSRYPYARAVDNRDEGLLAAIDAWLAAAQALADALADNGDQVRKGREMVTQGMCLPDAIATVSTTERYLRMTKVLADFDVARFALRSALVTAALAEGLTHRELVDLLGVPPELTAVVLDELERQRPTET